MFGRADTGDGQAPTMCGCLVRGYRARVPRPSGYKAIGSVGRAAGYGSLVIGNSQEREQRRRCCEHLQDLLLFESLIQNEPPL
jgi:hypothetical protein